MRRGDLVVGIWMELIAFMMVILREYSLNGFNKFDIGFSFFIVTLGCLLIYSGLGDD